ncbi:MAG: class I SAM-dependent methyltransferase [Deltaproteobacteria bacterium]|nr:class I SAM-dependent methyltransferase [Deltaproteobacteria bacterium]
MDEIAITARVMAYMRSLDVEVSGDIFAHHFVTDEAKSLADSWLAVYPGNARHGALRCRYMEGRAATYIQRGALQMINIAAGLNTFPYRHPAARALQYFAEFDLPNMLTYKEETVRRLITEGMIPSTTLKVSYHVADLTADITPVLEQLCWDWSHPTVVLMEGISYYIPRAALQAVIHTLGRFCAKGSVIIFDYLRIKDTKTPLYKTFYDSIAPRGEVFHTVFDDEGVVRLFTPWFRVISDRTITDIEKEYCADQRTIDFASYLVAERTA